MTDRKHLRAKIEAAKKVIAAATIELGRVAKHSAAAPRAEKVEASDVVRAASLKLRAAEAELGELEKLLELAKIQEAKTRVDSAKQVIIEAEKDLDKVIADMVVEASRENTFVTEVIEAAFTKLRVAKQELIDLEKPLGTDEQ